MKKSYKTLEEKRRQIAGKIIIGIDPGKTSHQAVAQDPYGITMGKPFTFAQSPTGYHHTLPQKLHKILPEDTDYEIIFAVERSCNLWQCLCNHLYNIGHQVVLVSPLATHQARPMINQDFSRTDQKDALAVASNARAGYFDDYRVADDRTEAIKYVPEVRSKYLKRQIDKASYRKNLVAATPKLLELIFALCRDGRCYETRPETMNTLAELETHYREKQKPTKNRRNAA